MIFNPVDRRNVRRTSIYVLERQEPRGWSWSQQRRRSPRGVTDAPAARVFVLVTGRSGRLAPVLVHLGLDIVSKVFGASNIETLTYRWSTIDSVGCRLLVGKLRHT